MRIRFLTRLEAVAIGGMAVSTVILLFSVGASVVALKSAAFAGLFIGTVAMGASVVLTFYADKRAEVMIRQGHMSLCPDCGYDLRGLESPGRCPECGEPFSLAEVRAWWRRRYGLAHEPPDSEIAAKPSSTTAQKILDLGARGQ